MWRNLELWLFIGPSHSRGSRITIYSSDTSFPSSLSRDNEWYTRWLVSLPLRQGQGHVNSMYMYGYVRVYTKANTVPTANICRKLNKKEFSGVVEYSESIK